MKTTTKILALVSFLSLGFAGVAKAGEGPAQRGQVNVQAAGAKAVVAGPAVVKVYSGFSGAKVFVTEAASGTDADCTAAAGRAAAATLTADRVERVSVGAGQIACVASTGTKSVELLWHAQPAAPAAAMLAKR
jgi:squalene cyclase